MWRLESGEGASGEASLELFLFKVKHYSGLGVSDNYFPIGGCQLCELSGIRYVKILYRYRTFHCNRSLM